MASATPGLDGWVLLIISVGTSTTAGGIINAFLSRRKTNVDVNEAMARTGKTAAEITGVEAVTAGTQVSTSLAMLVEMRADMVVLREDLAAARKETADARAEASIARREAEAVTAELALLQRWMKAYSRLLEDHALWDAHVVVVVRDLGGTIDPPPPLYPDLHDDHQDENQDA